MTDQEYDRQGRPISRHRYRQLKADDNYRTIALTKFPDGTYVVTSWMGQVGWADGRPLLFETLVYPECIDCVRYHTEAQAVAGHDQMAAKIRDRVQS